MGIGRRVCNINKPLLFERLLRFECGLYWFTCTACCIPLLKMMLMRGVVGKKHYYLG